LSYAKCAEQCHIVVFDVAVFVVVVVVVFVVVVAVAWFVRFAFLSGFRLCVTIFEYRR
jgi:uncharacterized protein HemY